MEKHTFRVYDEDGSIEEFTMEGEDRAHALGNLIFEETAHFLDAARIEYVMTAEQIRRDILDRIRSVHLKAIHAEPFINSALAQHHRLGRDVSSLRKYSIKVGSDGMVQDFYGVDANNN